MATVAQIAAPQGTARSRGDLRGDTTALAFPGAHESGDSCADGSPPGDGEVSESSAWDTTALALPGGHESDDNCALRLGNKALV